MLFLQISEFVDGSHSLIAAKIYARIGTGVVKTCCKSIANLRAPYRSTPSE